MPEKETDSETGLSYKKEYMWLSRFVVVGAINRWLEAEGHKERIEDFMVLGGDVRCNLKLE